MYKFTDTNTGAVIGMTEAPTYIKQAKNGCFVLCGAEEAQGAVYNGTPYHLSGRPPMQGAETVVMEELDAGAALAEAEGRLTGLEDALCEQDAATEARLTDIEDAVCELDSAINGSNKTGGEI